MHSHPHPPFSPLVSEHPTTTGIQDGIVGMPPRPASPSFYKRPLPGGLTPFSSERGKKVFAQALAEGGMEAYFPLASQFLTQNEPAYCGLGSLCMTLNALEIDPQRKWKGPWRWYEQEMLDCCRPLTAIAEAGITLAELGCLARCNGLSADVVSPRPSSAVDPESRASNLEAFRKDLKLATTGEKMMILGYSRKTLGQTGDGHFSPIGGFSEKDDMVLILDVARFKYPPYWITVEQAWDAMLPIDKASGLPRGYMLLAPLPDTNPLSLAAPQSLTTLSLNKSSWANLSNSLAKLIFSLRNSTSPEELVTSVAHHLDQLPLPILTARDGTASKLSPLLHSLESTQIRTLSNPRIPLNTFALLTLFTPKSPLAKLVPTKLEAGVRDLVEEALSVGGVGVKAEVEVLGTQIAALGECCRSEESGGAACGCATVNVAI